MAPIKSTKSIEKESAKGHEDQDAFIQGLDKSMITMTAIIQKCVYESNSRLCRTLKEVIDHEDRTARMLQDFEHTVALESEKAEQDRKVTTSAFLTELESMKQDALDTYAATTKVNVKTEGDSPSPERIESGPYGLNPDGEPKRLPPSLPLISLCLIHQNGSLKW